MIATLVAIALSAMYCAEADPWFGSEKHSWNILSLPSVTVGEDADGVSIKIRSAFASALTVNVLPVIEVVIVGLSLDASYGVQVPLIVAVLEAPFVISNDVGSTLSD